MNEAFRAYSPSRRMVLRGLTASLALLTTTAMAGVSFAQSEADGSAPFDFDMLTKVMREKAQSAYTPAEIDLPAFVAELDYDQYRMIQFNADRARWRDGPGPYRIHAFHPGWLFKESVELFEVTDGQAALFDFSVDDFRYHGKLADEQHHEALPGIAGFRVNYPLNTPDAFDELVSFLGASYFRALGKGNVYGLSARGLVLNSWLEGPEEFPRFSQFYLDKPKGDGPLVLHAALDSPSVTGAYRFVITPGEETVMEVTARLFFRADVAEVGIAPLTSMFLYADANRSDFDDFRPQVHDSNGLFIARSDGETVWRALNNPTSLGNSYFGDDNPRGFGLHQRGRDFEGYQDAGAHYERRPSLNVEPVGDWGPGAVRLIEIPSRTEADDNIVAFWVPGEPAKAGDEREYAYTLRWGDLPPSAIAETAFVAETRAGQGGVSGIENAATLRKFVVDFEGGPLVDLDPQTKLDVVASVSGGTLKFSTVSRIEANGRWRLVLDVEIEPGALVELRAYLVGLGRKLTETWLYQWRAVA